MKSFITLARWSFNAYQMQITRCYLKSLETDARWVVCHASMMMIGQMTEETVVLNVYCVVFVTIARSIFLKYLILIGLWLIAYCA